MVKAWCDRFGHMNNIRQHDMTTYFQKKKNLRLALLTLAHLFISDKRTPVLSTMVCRVAWWPRVTISNTMMRTRKCLSESGQEIVEKYIKTVFVKYYVQITNNRHYTGCPTKLFYNQFLGLWCTKNFYHGHFSTALSVGCSKLSNILKIEQYLTKLWRKCWQRNKTKSNKIQQNLCSIESLFFS